MHGKRVTFHRDAEALGLGGCARVGGSVATILVRPNARPSVASYYQRFLADSCPSTESTSDYDAITSWSSQLAINAINSKLLTSSVGAAGLIAISSISRRSDPARSKSFAIFSNAVNFASRASLFAFAASHY